MLNQRRANLPQNSLTFHFIAYFWLFLLMGLTAPRSVNRLG